MPSIEVQLPSVWRTTATGDRVRVDAISPRDALRLVGLQHPDVRRHLLADDGEPRRFIRVFRGDRDIRLCGGWDAPLDDGELLTVISAVAGG